MYICYEIMFYWIGAGGGGCTVFHPSLQTLLSVFLIFCFFLYIFRHQALSKQHWLKYCHCPLCRRAVVSLQVCSVMLCLYVGTYIDM